MSESSLPLLLICLVGLVALAYPITLYFQARRGQTIAPLDLFRRASQRARRPWGPEEDNLEELSKRVEELRSTPDEEGRS